MTPEQISDLFVSAAETERRLPSTGERPARLKAQAIPYVNDQADMNGWGGERYEEQRLSFWDNMRSRPSSSDVSEWELANELIAYVPKVEHRHALWAWSRAQAGTLKRVVPTDDGVEFVKMGFGKWCRDVAHIHRNTGTQRKILAVSCIAAIFLRNTLLDIRKLQFATLQDTPETGHKGVNIGSPREWTWTAPDAFSSEYPKASRFDPMKARNEARRERDKRRQAA